MAPFVPGLELAREFYEEVARRLLDEEFPGLVYAAALLGRGSEVLGFDSERSTDHDWGPRLQVFLADGEPRGRAAEITTMFARRIPVTFRGYPTASAMHNELGMTEPLDPRLRPFWDRPYQVLDAGRFAAALLAAITDPGIRQLPPIGAVDEFVDSTDALGRPAFLRAAITAADPRARRSGRSRTPRPPGPATERPRS